MSDAAGSLTRWVPLGKSLRTGLHLRLGDSGEPSDPVRGWAVLREGSREVPSPLSEAVWRGVAVLCARLMDLNPSPYGLRERGRDLSGPLTENRPPTALPLLPSVCGALRRLFVEAGSVRGLRGAIHSLNRRGSPPTPPPRQRRPEGTVAGGAEGRSSCGEGPLPSLSPYGEGSKSIGQAQSTATPRHTGSERGEAPRRTRTGPGGCPGGSYRDPCRPRPATHDQRPIAFLPNPLASTRFLTTIDDLSSPAPAHLRAGAGAGVSLASLRATQACWNGNGAGTNGGRRLLDKHRFQGKLTRHASERVGVGARVPYPRQRHAAVRRPASSSRRNSAGGNQTGGSPLQRREEVTNA